MVSIYSFYAAGIKLHFLPSGNRHNSGTVGQVPRNALAFSITKVYGKLRTGKDTLKQVFVPNTVYMRAPCLHVRKLSNPRPALRQPATVSRLCRSAFFDRLLLNMKIISEILKICE